LRSVPSSCPAAKRCDPCCCCYPDTCPSAEPAGCNGNKSSNSSSPITNGSGQQQQQQQQPFNSPSTLPLPNYPQSSDRPSSPVCPGDSKNVLGSNQQLTDTAATTDSKTLLSLLYIDFILAKIIEYRTVENTYIGVIRWLYFTDFR